MSKRFPPINDLSPKYWAAWLVIIIGWSLSKIPYAIQIKLAGLMGKLFAKIAGSRLNALEKNIKLCFPELSAEEQRDLVEKNLRSTALFFLEVINMVWAKNDKMEKRYDITGLNVVTEQIACGKGVLLVTGHMHATASLITLLCNRGPASLVYRELDDPILNKYLVEPVQRKLGLDLIGRKDMKNMLQQLKDGQIVMIVPDQDLKSTRSVFIPFFGIQTLTVTTIPDYAHQTGATVVFAHAYRDDDWKRHKIVFELLENYPSGDDVADTQTWSDRLESAIKAHPDQYLWIHQRFKRRPEGEEPVY